MDRRRTPQRVEREMTERIRRVRAKLFMKRTFTVAQFVEALRKANDDYDLTTDELVKGVIKHLKELKQS